MRAVVLIVVLAVWLYCVIEVVSTHEEDTRNLPKLWWLILVLLFPLAGSVAWLVAGRPKRVSAVSGPGSPDDDEAFLRALAERVERERRRRNKNGEDREQPS